jgi:mono/diheme cytochrome c family protein
MFRRLLLVAALSCSAPVLAGDMVKAKLNYDRHCAACHGFNGMSLSPDVPNLRLNQGLMQGDLQIVQKLKMGSQRKPPMMGLMSDQELMDIVIYTRSIK